ncbi:MAG: heat-inducible transcription repressor HrcA [Armatimonadetes bacterium]|nr:heat-inducible transcription repressor HrcA [Armatimonadota bacterium]
MTTRSEYLCTSALSEREALVLRYIVQHYILTANPVGSRYLSKRLEEESISAATIRNVMADLEEKGYITHPHTSAGRVPTDLGYRLYVDGFAKAEPLTPAERAAIHRQLDIAAPTTVMMRDLSRIIGDITQQLGIVTAPEILGSRLERIELVQLSSSRLLVVLSLDSGLVRTITLEIHQEMGRERLLPVVEVLNQRLTGLTLLEIRASCHDRLRDVALDDSTQIVQAVIASNQRIFSPGADVDRLAISPAQNILRHPEFASPEQLRGVVELIENQEMIIHLLEEHPGEENRVEVTIGSEHSDERLKEYSLITTRYQNGNSSGTIGLIGPRRMNYSRMITVVEYVARIISDPAQDR